MLKEFYSSFMEDELWLIKENEWARVLQNIREAQLSLGNGYFATRAVLEEIPYDAIPGTYIAGVFDNIGSQVAELVNLPNPFNFKFTVNGEKIGIVAMDHILHKRVLNTKKGLLIRRTLYENTKKHQFDYQSLRFVSMSDRNIGVMQIIFTPLSKSCWADVYTGIDTSVFNHGTLTEGRKRHFKVKEVDQFRNAGYLAIETLEKKHTIIYWSGFYYDVDGKKFFAKDNVLQLRLKRNQTIKFTKIFFIKHFPCGGDLKKYRETTFRKFYKFFHTPLDKLLNRHIKTWDKLWRKADIVIEGTANLQQNLRFNIYHMLICANNDNGFSSIGARTLTGEGYRGHIFWDAEIFLMPFYLFNFPQLAQNMLLYRYRRLDKARELAKREGFRGAKFPWEAADSGEEETPTWARDLDGRVIKIHTHEMEHHITADVAYAFYKYYVSSKDTKFMENFGYEVMFETARFWTSRVKYNKRREKYEITHVIGPDEFHIEVNNNAYTNAMAKWNLITAYKMFCKAKKESPSVIAKLKRKLNLKEKEARVWKEIASQISIPIDRSNGIIEQFDGFFKLKKVHLRETDENGIPLIPRHLKIKELKYTQLVKQADVLMLVYLLDDIFKWQTKKINYDFYIPRTVHRSSLSPSIHSIVACECGDLHTAYNLFNVSLRTDISNLYGNTKEGIHAASLGGTWQAVIFGFAGVKIKKDTIFISPRMPRTWGRMRFSLFWRGDLWEFDLTKEVVRVKIVSKRRKRVEIGVFNKKYVIRTNKVYTFRRKGIVPIVEYHY